ncbi:YbhB/YbcL family Raf kinase inhibitor-like protein [Rhodocyclus tenuis]|uniref:YbhB/YbcL family Raf kinase inhibitor-like protein n=1 Tax=Rhodocyclus gracilis TaxID=2929842 RepID=UPI0012989F20|nr:YbhB/YbcL family Raf kinase inhibitor-like protein [Rhodocyclus gracilis]MRD73646.1 YbhB/YbcL family Raf kinase inhibitor-like protein [Rhodocyclus gracilis]
MQLFSESFSDHGAIPGEFAFCVADPLRHVRLGGNRNPHLAWRDVPAATQSFVLICADPDVPSRGDDVNREGSVVSASLPRVEFFHWLLVDLPASASEIRAGEFSTVVTPRGKAGPSAAKGARQGINDYTGWFDGDPDMRGDYFGYDGPCPPWNDELVHRYVFTLYALDVAQLPAHGPLTGAVIRAAMAGHILDTATLTGRYTLNPAIVL